MLIRRHTFFADLGLQYLQLAAVVSCVEPQQSRRRRPFASACDATRDASKPVVQTTSNNSGSRSNRPRVLFHDKQSPNTKAQREFSPKTIPAIHTSERGLLSPQRHLRLPVRISRLFLFFAPPKRSRGWFSLRVAASASSLPTAAGAVNNKAFTKSDDAQEEACDPFQGAEWAGWECQFSPVDGSRLAVPEDYVPESLREWDVEVWGFETLTSEERRQADAGNGDRDDAAALYRKRGRVYPEVGCALDNLSLEVNVQTSPLQGKDIFFTTFTRGNYVLAKKTEGSDALQIEVGLTPDDLIGLDGEAQNDSDPEERRCRFGFQLDRTDGGGSGGIRLSPVTITRERKYNVNFDDGLLYKGGGLDSQKLARFLGSKCFAEEEAAPTPTELVGEWRSDLGQWKMFNGGSLDPSPFPNQSTTQSRKPESHWTNDGAKSGDGSGNERFLKALFRGGFTLRAGAYPSKTPEMWGSAATKTPDGAREGWAVEVGWLGAGEEPRREIMTTVVDVERMIPLGVWRGSEAR